MPARRSCRPPCPVRGRNSAGQEGLPSGYASWPSLYGDCPPSIGAAPSRLPWFRSQPQSAPDHAERIVRKSGPGFRRRGPSGPLQAMRSFKKGASDPKMRTHLWGRCSSRKGSFYLIRTTRMTSPDRALITTRMRFPRRSRPETRHSRSPRTTRLTSTTPRRRAIPIASRSETRHLEPGPRRWSESGLIRTPPGPIWMLWAWAAAPTPGMTGAASRSPREAKRESRTNERRI